MGREIRRVPADWEHPVYTRTDARHPEWVGSYRGLHDDDIVSASVEWIESVRRWEAGEDENRPILEARLGRRAFFWEWDGNPPNPEYYRDRAWTPEEATHYQIYETVSEGSPVSPVFGSLAEVEAWLVEQGSSPAAASAFCRAGWAPSMVISQNADGSRSVAQDIEAMGLGIA